MLIERLNRRTADVISAAHPSGFKGPDGSKATASEMRELGVYVKGRVDEIESILGDLLGGVP